METIKKGDIVGRKSYNEDILFYVKRVVPLNGEKIAILKGLCIRIEADAPLSDLTIIKKQTVKNRIGKIENRLDEKIKIGSIGSAKSKRRIGKIFNNRSKIEEVYGKILHIDGDRKYSEKSAKYYKKLGLNAVVRNISENIQQYAIIDLLNRYKPDILVITGHDGMIKSGTGYNDIYNYRNSKYFINTVLEAKKWAQENKAELVIFAGACQSYYEALVAAGANFASSPARVLIDFVDPIVVAEKIATTEEYKYVTINDIANDLRDGTKGISGIGGLGKKKVLL